MFRRRLKRIQRGETICTMRFNTKNEINKWFQSISTVQNGFPVECALAVPRNSLNAQPGKCIPIFTALLSATIHYSGVQYEDQTTWRCAWVSSLTTDCRILVTFTGIWLEAWKMNSKESWESDYRTILERQKESITYGLNPPQMRKMIVQFSARFEASMSTSLALGIFQFSLLHIVMQTSITCQH